MTATIMMCLVGVTGTAALLVALVRDARAVGARRQGKPTYPDHHGWETASRR